MKYIDSEKLIAEIERLSAEHSSRYGMDEAAIVLDKLEDFITSLQPDQLANIVDFVIKNPQPSLPSNLDEAAEEYKQGEIDTYADYYDDTGEPLCFMEALKDAFKAGAEWLAGQGVSMQITDDTEWADLDSFVHKNVTGGSIIQIRKK